MRKRFKILIGAGITIGFILLLVLSSSKLRKLIIQTSNTKESNSEITKEFYSMALPDGITIKYSENNDYRDGIYMDDQEVGCVQINQDCGFDLSISSIVANYLGMHAYIKDDVEKKDFGTYQRYKILTGFEASAAQQEKGELTSDELHYFFIKDDLLLDLYVDLNYLDEKNVEFIANAVELK